jgi:hypothetical protein
MISISGTVTIAETLFDASAVAVTVTVYVPDTDGVQTILLLPLLTQVKPAGLADTVKSVFCAVTGIVAEPPTYAFTVCVCIEMLAGCLVLLFLLEEPPPPQAAKNSKNIVAAINKDFFRVFMILHGSI